MADGGAAAQALTAGRSCPPHYGYSPRVFARAADAAADCAYVIGGLYGNVLALDAIEAMAAAEAAPPLLVFNGDFHWFDAAPALFSEVQKRVLAAGRMALRGNVETEIAGEDDGAGCGCAYPDSVPDADVERSNAILARLRAVAAAAGSRAALAALPMHRVLAIGGARVAVVHGDAWSLAGWRFAHDALHDPAQEAALRSAFELGAVDVYACSHTCAPALKRVPAAHGEGFVVNNGAAGMASFAGSAHGLITRIATRALPHALAGRRRYGVHTGAVWIDALQVEFDLPAWLARFDALWPTGTAAALSYRHRLVNGPPFTVDTALGRKRGSGIPACPR